MEEVAAVLVSQIFLRRKKNIYVTFVYAEMTQSAVSQIFLRRKKYLAFVHAEMT